MNQKLNFKKLKKLKFLLIVLGICLNVNIIKAADIESVLGLISAPIAGFSLPENMIAQARAYLLSHPDINYEALEAKLIAARGVVQSAIAGKEIKSLSDIAKSVTAEQRNAVIADLQNVATEANVSVAVDNFLDMGSASNKDTVAVVDKETGAPVFTRGSIIKATGRTPNVSLKCLKSSLFCILFFIESVFISKYMILKYNLKIKKHNNI